MPRPPNSRGWRIIGCSPGVPPLAKSPSVSSLTNFFGLSLAPSDRQLVCWIRGTLTIGELVEAIELADAAQHRNAGERVPPFPRRVVQERRAPEGTPQLVSRPAVPGPRDEPMPTEPPRSPNRAWLAGCTAHHEPPGAAPRAEVKVNGRPFQALLDSGSAVSLIQPAVLSPRVKGHPVHHLRPWWHATGARVAGKHLCASRSLASWSWNCEKPARPRAPRERLARFWPPFCRRHPACQSRREPPSTEAEAKSPPTPPCCWHQTAREMVSPPPKPLTFTMMFSSRCREGAHSQKSNTGRSPQALLDTSESDRGKGGPASAPSDNLTSLSRMACFTVSHSEGGRKKLCWWYRGPRLRSWWSWRPRIRWPAT